MPVSGGVNFQNVNPVYAPLLCYERRHNDAGIFFLPPSPSVNIELILYFLDRVENIGAKMAVDGLKNRIHGTLYARSSDNSFDKRELTRSVELGFELIKFETD